MSAGTKRQLQSERFMDVVTVRDRDHCPTRIRQPPPEKTRIKCDARCPSTKPGRAVRALSPEAPSVWLDEKASRLRLETFLLRSIQNNLTQMKKYSFAACAVLLSLFASFPVFGGEEKSDAGPSAAIIRKLAAMMPERKPQARRQHRLRRARIAPTTLSGPLPSENPERRRAPP